MTREQAKELLPVIQAFADGKTIQYYSTHPAPHWEDILSNERVDFSKNSSKYRIKPEPKYRPFKDAEECWTEMRKHQPVGFMKFKDTESGYYMLTSIASGVGVGINDSLFSYDRVFDDYTFADGVPFGVKEE